MIQIISSAIVKWLLKAGAISPEDRELYEYAAYSLLFSLVPLVLVMVISAFMGMLPQGIAFVLPFLLLRKFSGGYHLETPEVCFCVSITVILFFMLAIKYLIWANAHSFCIPVAIISAIQLMVFSPIDSDARKLSENEAKVFKRIARVLTVVHICAFAAAILVGLKWVAICISAGVFLTACLQWPSIIKKYCVKC